MKWETVNTQKRLYLVAAIVLVVGLGSASMIYMTAGKPSDNTMIQDFENSKRYIHDLELYGGKFNVLTDQFRRWFESLWHGKSLALTISFITVLISMGFALVGYLWPLETSEDEDERGVKNR